MSTVEVRSIDALEELQSSLIRYADHAQATLEAAQRELQRTLDWLEERVRHWRNEIARCQEMERRAIAAYQRCMASGDRDHPPFCGREEQAVQEARRRLVEAQQQERLASQARQAVQTEADAYLREAGRLKAMIQSDAPKAVATLRHKVTVLRDYAGLGVNAGGLSEISKLAVRDFRKVQTETTSDLSEPSRRYKRFLANYERRYRGLIAEKALARLGGISLNELKPNSPVYDHLFYRESASVKTHMPSTVYQNQHLAAYAHDLRVAIGATSPKRGKYAGQNGPAFAAHELRNVDIPGFDAQRASDQKVEEYLQETATIRVPSDHVEDIKSYIKYRASANPSKYGLRQDFSETEMDDLLHRIRPLPLTSEQIGEAARKQVDLLRKSDADGYNT